MKFVIILISIRILAQVLFIYAYINRDITEYSVTTRACFQYLITDIQISLYLFKDLLLNIFVNLYIKRLSSFLS